MSKIIFMGTSQFAVPSLMAINKQKSSYEVVGVFTRSDKKAERNNILTKSPIKEVALKNNLPIFQPTILKDKKIISLTRQLSPEVIVVAAYGQIIPPTIIKIPPWGIINLHASLLPQYRGPSPIQTAILNGDKKIGVSLMLIDEQLDHGPLLASQELAIAPYDNFKTLQDKLALVGAALLLKTLPRWLRGEIKPQEQEHEQASYTPLIKKEYGRADWNREAQYIERQLRAFYPWPGVFTFFKNKRLKIIKGVLLADEYRQRKKIGEIFTTTKKKPAVCCGRGAIVLERVQLAGKKEISGTEFMAGYQPAGVVLG